MGKRSKKSVEKSATKTSELTGDGSPTITAELTGAKSQKSAAPKASKTSSKKKPINGNAKGKAFERDIATDLGEIFPDAQRQLEFRASDNEGVDIEGTDIFKFQCKRYAGYAPINKINEIRSTGDIIPVLVTKGNKLPTVAVLPWDRFLHLVKIAYGLEVRLKHPDVKGIQALEQDRYLQLQIEVAGRTPNPILLDMPMKYVTATEVLERKAERDAKIHEAMLAPFAPLIEHAVKIIEKKPSMADLL